MKRPLLFPLLGLMGGIFFSQASSHMGVFVAFVAVFLIAAFFLSFRRLTLAMTLLLIPLFFGVGRWVTVHHLRSIEKNSNLSSWVGDQKYLLVGQVLNPCEEDEEGGSVVLEAREIGHQNEVFPLSGKFLLRFGKGSCSFEVGDRLQTLATDRLQSTLRW